MAETTMHPDDVWHVVIDAVASMKRAIEITHADPWRTYGPPQADDPKTMPDGYVAALDAAHDFALNMLDGSVPVAPDAAICDRNAVVLLDAIRRTTGWQIAYWDRVDVATALKPDTEKPVDDELWAEVSNHPAWDCIAEVAYANVSDAGLVSEAAHMALASLGRVETDDG